MTPSRVTWIICAESSLLFITLLKPGEKYCWTTDTDGLGVQVTVISSRLKALLKGIRAETFSGFAFLGIQRVGRKYRTRFRALEQSHKYGASPEWIKSESRFYPAELKVTGSPGKRSWKR